MESLESSWASLWETRQERLGQWLTFQNKSDGIVHYETDRIVVLSENCRLTSPRGPRRLRSDKQINEVLGV